eukprot:3703163-Pleurochrysis_carterae.AAC.1
MEHAHATKTFATPLYVPDPPDPRTSETTTENCKSPKVEQGRAQPKNSTTKWVVMTAMMTLVAPSRPAECRPSKVLRRCSLLKAVSEPQLHSKAPR